MRERPWRARKVDLVTCSDLCRGRQRPRPAREGPPERGPIHSAAKHALKPSGKNPWRPLLLFLPCGHHLLDGMLLQIVDLSIKVHIQYCNLQVLQALTIYIILITQLRNYMIVVIT
jgi:hypothetical protein